MSERFGGSMFICMEEAESLAPAKLLRGMLTELTTGESEPAD